MPNQRKKGKTRIAVWLTQSQRDALDRAVELGAAKDMSDFVVELDPAVEAKYRKALGYEGKIERMERFAFYERAKKAYAVVVSGETAKYGNIILKKGVTPIAK